MFTFLLTDIFFYIIIISLIMYVAYVRKTPDILANWLYVFRNRTGILSIVVLSFFIITSPVTGFLIFSAREAKVVTL